VFTVPSWHVSWSCRLIIGTRVLDEANVVVALNRLHQPRSGGTVLDELDARCRPGERRPTPRSVSADQPDAKVENCRWLSRYWSRVAGGRGTNTTLGSGGSVIGIGGLGTWVPSGYPDLPRATQHLRRIIALFLLAIVIDF